MKRSLTAAVAAGVAALALAVPGGAGATAVITSPWSQDTVPLPPGAGGGALQAVSCLAGGACVAVGNYLDAATGSYQPLAETRSGGTWTATALPVPSGAQAGYLKGVDCLTVKDCWAAGYWVNSSKVNRPLVEKWNGTAWTVQASPPLPHGAASGELLAVSCSSGSLCDVAGMTSYPGQDSFFGLVDRLKGGTWTSEGIQVAAADSDELTGIACPNAFGCEAVGDWIGNNGEDQPLAMGWNGEEWAQQTAPLPAGGSSGSLTALSCQGACTASGMFTNSRGISRPWAARGDGETWTAQTVALPDGDSGDLTGVSCFTTGHCSAAGFHSPSQGGSSGLAENWNGTTWTKQALASPAAGDFPNALSCGSAANCVLVGAIQSGQGEPLAGHKGTT